MEVGKLGNAMGIYRKMENSYKSVHKSIVSYNRDNLA